MAANPYRTAFGDLEPDICRVRELARMQAFLAEMIEEDGTEEFKASCLKSMVTTANLLFKEADALEDLWLARHNAMADEEMAQATKARAS